MNFAHEAGQIIHLKAGMTVVLEAGVELTLKVGGNFIDIGPAGVTIVGTMVMINSGGAAGSGCGSSPTSPEGSGRGRRRQQGRKDERPELPEGKVAFCSAARFHMLIR